MFFCIFIDGLQRNDHKIHLHTL